MYFNFATLLHLSFLFVFLLDGSSSSSVSETKIRKCSPDLEEGRVCEIHPKDVLPLQYGIASIEVDCKKRRFESMTTKELDRYLEKPKNYVRIVIGPGGRFYLTDGHHMSKALLDADVKDSHKTLYCTVLANLADLDMDDFWDYLIEHNMIWLYDEKGMAPIAPEHLPSSLSHMLDDPYRTLVWMVQKAGGFVKTGTDFEDFVWSNFYRLNIDLGNTARIYSSDQVQDGRNSTTWKWCQVRPTSRRCIPDVQQSLEKIIPLALLLSSSEEAAHLPGYGVGIAEAPNCGSYEGLAYLKSARAELFSVKKY